MWESRSCVDFENRYASYQKKHRQSLKEATNHVDTLLRLVAFTKPAQIKLGFIHREPKGVLALAGGGKCGSLVVRLYVYPDEDEEVLVLLTLGDKQTQRQDIKDCCRWVDDHLRLKTGGAGDGNVRREEDLQKRK